VVEAAICLNCGSIEYLIYGNYTRYYKSSLDGIRETDYGEDDGSEAICSKCNLEKMNFFDLDMLSTQEKVLFFHYSDSRRLLMFLRLIRAGKKDLLGLSQTISDGWIDNKIKELESLQR